MATTPEDENKSKRTSPQAQLPEASCTADDFYDKYLNEVRNINVGPFSYPDPRDHSALPWDFPTRDFLDALSTDAKNTLRYQLLVARIARDERRARYLPQHVPKSTEQIEPGVRAQFEAKLEAMNSLLGMVAQAIGELDDKALLWMEVKKNLRWNVEVLEKLIGNIDQLSDDGTKAE